MKKKKETLTDKEQMYTLDALYTTASSIQGRAAMKTFLRDLLTESERIMLGRRIIIARLLLNGRSHYEIRAKTRAGFNTIERVAHWLSDKIPGYEDAISGFEKELQTREKKHLYRTSALFRLKKKYPLHFLFFPLPKTKKNTNPYE